MVRPPVPGSVTLGRVLLIVEAVLWLLGAIAIALAGVAVLAVPNGSVASQVLSNVHNSNVTLTTIGVSLVVAGVVMAVIAVVGISAGASLRRLTTGPRVTGIVLATVGLLIGLVDLVGAGRRVHDARSAIAGVILIALNLVILYAIGFAPTARAAFRAMAASRQYGPPAGFAASSGAYAAPGEYLNPYASSQQQMYVPPARAQPLGSDPAPAASPQPPADPPPPPPPPPPP